MAIVVLVPSAVRVILTVVGVVAGVVVGVEEVGVVRVEVGIQVGVFGRGK